jgi:histidinol-phosphate aminotransferase
MNNTNITNTLENSNINLEYPQYVAQMSAYIAGKPIDEVAREFNLDAKSIVKLASNENPYGISDLAKQAMLDYLTQANKSEPARYPDANQFKLRSAIAKKFNIDSNCITFGNGSNDILELLARTLVNPRTEAIMYDQYSFAVYALATQAMGAQAQIIKSNEQYGHDLNGMLNAINQQTKLIFIANPNNPTGTFIPADELVKFIQGVPKNIIIVLDEAYNEYLDAELQYNSIEWVKQHSNLIVCRTFSKAYGLAALRVGYCVASAEITDYLNRVRQPFNVNSLALLAAEQALNDDEFLHKTCISNKYGYAQIIKGLDKLDIKYIPSYGNFIMMHTGKFSGAELNKKLLAKGVIIRPLGSYELHEYVRVSIGLPSENERFLEVIQEIYS